MKHLSFSSFKVIIKEVSFSFLSRFLLLMLLGLLGCFDSKKEIKVLEATENESSANAEPPIDPKVLDPAPSAQENLGGSGGPDSIDEEGALNEPLPPASEGSPYKSSEAK